MRTSCKIVQTKISHWQEKSFIVEFLTDAEKPQITCVEQIKTARDVGFTTAMVTWEKPDATDNSGNVSDVICNPLSGTEFGIGQTIVTCEAVDESKNKGECSFQVEVTGVYQPILILSMCGSCTTSMQSRELLLLF